LNEDGGFAGVVVASLNPEHLTRFYERLDLGSSASIFLVGNDGVVRSSGGSAGDFALGQDLSRTEIFARIEAGANATFEFANSSDAEPQFVTIRKVRGHPLWISVSVAKSDIYKGSRASLRINLAGGLLLTIIILTALERVFRTEARKQEAEADVARLASEDPLTGLPNRRVFRAALDEVLRLRPCHVSDSGQNQQIAVLFMDLDRFKIINDTLGHHVGDRLLQDVARRLKHSLWGADVLARLGGDEFAVVVSGVEDASMLEALAKRLVDAAGQAYEIDGQQIRTSISVGIAVSPQDGESAEDLLMAADMALYAVKAARRGAYKFYDPSMNKEVSERRQIETDLRNAIGANELELYYQPIINVRGDALCGFEALVRWRHPTQGLVSPAVFIPVAEDTQLILPLGEWVLREACREAARWRPDLRIAVNLSPVQLSDPNLADIVERVLAETGLRPDRLDLEITEQVFIDDCDQVIAVLQRLKRLGVRIAMDDFGTGYSSLSYLRSFPFDKIKSDRIFIADLAKGAEHASIVQAVISMAHAFGMTTTAEGVETLGQHQFLSALGCDEAQGFLLGRPQSVADLEVSSTAWAGGKSFAA